jgi:hypothetical protein
MMIGELVHLVMFPENDDRGTSSFGDVSLE